MLLRCLSGAPGLRVMRALGQRLGRPALHQVRRDAMALARPLQLPGLARQSLAWSWGEHPTATVALVHGWGGCAAQLTPLAVQLARAGWRCVALDVTGHGQTPGTSSSLRCFVDDTATLADALGVPVFAHVGRSAGGLAATRGTKGLRAQRHVCIGTPVAPAPPVHAMQRRLAPQTALLAAYAEHLAGRVGASWQLLERGACFAGLGRALLLLHDEQDRVADHREAHRIQAWCPGSVQVNTQGCGHARVLESPQLARTVAAFLNCSA